MTSGQKIAFSLLTAFALFAAFVLSFQSRLIKELEVKFYTQSKIQENKEQLDKISESCNLYIADILKTVENGENAWIKQSSVRSYYVQNPSESDVNERRKSTEQLFSQLNALQGIRIIDKNGRNVHFSTFDDTDILKQTGITKVYKNYNDIQKDADELPFEVLEKNTAQNKSCVLFDESKNRLIVYVPFCWMDNFYSGLCLFYFNVFDIEKDLISQNTIAIGQGFSLFAEKDLKGGFVVNIPAGLQNQFREPILKYWEQSKNPTELKNKNPEVLLQAQDNKYYVALTSSRTGTCKITGVYTNDVFEITSEIKILIYICIFISIFLIIFLIFSFKRDPVVVLKKRIKKIQFAIISEYLENKEKVDWSHVMGQLKSRKNDFTNEILKSLNVHSKKRRKELDELLEKNWDEIFNIFETKAKTQESTGVNGASIEEIRKVLEDVLKNTVLKTSAPVVVPVQKKEEKIEEVEEVLDDAEEIEEVEEVLDDAEEIEEAEEVLDDAEEIEEVEEVLDDAEEIEEAEEVLDDAEEVEEVEEVLDDAEEIEEVEEVLDDAEEIEEAEEVLDDAEEIEEAEEVEELEDVVATVNEKDEVVDDVEELDADSSEVEAETAEEICGENEVIDDVEELEDADDWKENVNRDFSATLQLLKGIEYEYKPSKDTYIENEDFADVETLFAEEINLGEEFSSLDRSLENFNFNVYKFNSYDEEETDEVAGSEPEEEVAPVEEEVAPVEEEVAPAEEEPVPAEEEVAPVEEIPELDDMFYSMTRFGENLSNETPELEEVTKSENAIIEKDGVFSISENLEYSGIEQNKEFKDLVDSVL